MQKTLTLLGAVGTVAGVVAWATHSPADVSPPTMAAKSPALSIDPKIDSLLDVYGELMNNLELLNRGQFGIERIPGDPALLWHQNRERGVGFIVEHGKETGFLPVQTRLRELRREIRKSRGTFGDGLFALKSDPSNSFRGIWMNGIRSSAVAFWHGESSSLSDAYEIRGKKAFIDAAHRALKAIESNPERDFQTSVNGGTLHARAIKFESAKCISCHPGKKVGSVAAVAAAFSGREKPRGVVIPSSGPSTIPGASLPKLGLKEFPNWVEAEKPKGREFSTHKLYSYRFESTAEVKSILDFFVAQIERIPKSAFERRQEGPHSSWLSFEWGEKTTGNLHIDSREKTLQIRLSIRNLN